jgi:hypothetical protein
MRYEFNFKPASVKFLVAKKQSVVKMPLPTAELYRSVGQSWRQRGIRQQLQQPCQQLM